MYIPFLVLLSSSLICRFLLFPKSPHNNINNIELTTCNNDKAATASQLLYCNSARVEIGVISINTKKVYRIFGFAICRLFIFLQYSKRKFKGFQEETQTKKQKNQKIPEK